MVTANRRWPRLKISTILVLVGIAAWAMSMRPFLEVDGVRWGEQDARSALVLYTSADPFSMGYPFLQLGPVPQLYGPVIALVVFLDWKLMRAKVTHRLRERLISAPPPLS